MYVYHFGSLLQPEHSVYHLSLELCCRRRFHDNPTINHKHIFYFVFIFISLSMIMYTNCFITVSYHLHIVIVSFISVHVILFFVVIKLQISEEFMKKGANCKSIYNSNLSKNMIGLHHQKGKKIYHNTYWKMIYASGSVCLKKIKPTKHKH